LAGEDRTERALFGLRLPLTQHGHRKVNLVTVDQLAVNLAKPDSVRVVTTLTQTKGSRRIEGHLRPPR